MFTPGVSGNPAGRPKMTASLIELVERNLGVQGKAAVAKRLVTLAKQGNEQAIFCLVSLLERGGNHGQ